MAQILHLFRKPKRHLPMEELGQAFAILDFGFEGCKHARLGSKRQVLLADRETLDAMRLEPGILRENVTTQGLNVNGLSIGQRLQIGEACLEVTSACTPCGTMDRIRAGLRKELWGRRGMMCRVIQGGRIRCGDMIQKIDL
jgi:MOSC domain-containing protein YiiM